MTDKILENEKLKAEDLDNVAGGKGETDTTETEKKEDKPEKKRRPSRYAGYFTGRIPPNL